MSTKVKTNKYHHGDLRQALVDMATQQITDNGVASLSMRKLGELVGVSRTALYHHFGNKGELLSAVAESGFTQWQEQTEQNLEAEFSDHRAQLSAYVLSYFDFALNNSAKYELMFGKDIWREQQSSQGLHDIAYKTFEYHVSLIKRWQQQGILPAQPSPLRIAQVTWGALHGISKLFIDGIYIEQKNLQELTDTIVVLFHAK